MLDNFNMIADFNNIGSITYTIKILFLSLSIYCTSQLITNNKKIVISKLVIILLINIIISILVGIIKYYFDSFTSITTFVLLLAAEYSLITRINLGYSISVTLISLSINATIFFISVVFNFVINSFYVIQNFYINLLLIAIFHTTVLYFFFKIRRYRNGFIFLQKNFQNERFDILVLTLTAVVTFSFTLFTTYKKTRNVGLLVNFIIFAIILFTTIRKLLFLSYKHNLWKNEISTLRSELDNKTAEIDKLEKENLKFIKTSHSIAHKQQSIEYKVNKLLFDSEMALESDIIKRVKSLSTEINNFIPIIKLTKTEIAEIDDMLESLQYECLKNNIRFNFHLYGNIYPMIEHCSVEDLEILIADHIKNSIIAINSNDTVNRSIMVKLGKINGDFSLYIYDTGIEFKLDTLSKLLKVPITSHSNTGGTGMGFQNTFDTLNKYNASLSIYEKHIPDLNDYTKFISIIFNNKHEFKIYSYRSDILEHEMNNNYFSIENFS